MNRFITILVCILIAVLLFCAVSIDRAEPTIIVDEPTPLAELPIDQYELSYRESADSMTELVSRYKDRLTAEPTEEMLRSCASELYDFYDEADWELFTIWGDKGGWADENNNTLDRYRKMLYVTYSEQTEELTAFYETLLNESGENI